MIQLRSLIASPRPLAEVFVDALRRSENFAALRHLEGINHLEDCDQAQLPLEEGDTQHSRRPVTGRILPNQALAAILLGRTLDQDRDVITTIADGGVVVFEAPHGDLVSPLAAVFRRCIFDPPWIIKDFKTVTPADARLDPVNMIVMLQLDGSAKSHNPSSGNEELAIAAQIHCPIVAIVADAGRTLPRDLARMADRRVALLPIDGAAIAALTTALTGQAARTIDARVARAATLADISLAFRSDRSADECIGRLERLLVNSSAYSDLAPSLDSLCGLGEAKQWATELVSDLQDYRAGRIPWGLVLRSALIIGPPGTGKTTLARSIAQTAGVFFTATSYSQWQSAGDGHLGAVTRAIRNVFSTARNNAPSIVFIDEVDTVPARGSDQKNDSWFSSIVATILEELDGFDRFEGVITIAACNNPTKLDPALVRSGRFDRHIRIPLPDVAALAGIIRSHLGAELASVDLRPAAASAIGASGADAEKWVRGARRRARQAGRDLRLDDLVAEITDGNGALPEPVLRRVAYHEAGHAICALASGVGEPDSVALNVRGGLTRLQQSELTAQTASDLQSSLAYLLAGRAAEALVFGNVSAGAGGGETSDLALASRLAMNMETIYGLGEQGPMWCGGEEARALFHLDEIRGATRQTLERAQADARRILESNRPALDRLASALLANRYLDKSEIREVLVATPVVASMPAAASARDHAAHALPQSESSAL
jgi:ATP-dependent Zn protease